MFGSVALGDANENGAFQERQAKNSFAWIVFRPPLKSFDVHGTSVKSTRPAAM